MTITDSAALLSDASQDARTNAATRNAALTSVDDSAAAAAAGHEQPSTTQQLQPPLSLEDINLEGSQPVSQFPTAREFRQSQNRMLNNTDDDDDDEADARKEKHWRESPFAVGRVNVRWQDDRIPICKTFASGQRYHHICISGFVCGCIGAGRVGNLVVCLKGEEEYDHVTVDDETGVRTVSRRKRPTLRWVVGPYWWMNMCVTFPLIFGISGWIGYTQVVEQNMAIQITWGFCTFLMIFSLLMIACRNPGVMYRYDERPEGEEGQDWRWNDQAQTYRPKEARYDPECGVVVEGFDHTCPWTGTAIGSRNMFWFRIFTGMVPICIAWSIVLRVLF